MLQIRKKRKELLAKDSHSQSDQERQQTLEQIQAYKTTADKGALTVEDLKGAEYEIICSCQNQRFQDKVTGSSASRWIVKSWRLSQ